MKLHTLRLTAGWTCDGASQSRRFQWPKPLPENEYLVLGLILDAPGTVYLNDAPVGVLDDVGEVRIRLLDVQPRNLIRIDTAGHVAEAWLEVHLDDRG